MTNSVPGAMAACGRAERSRGLVARLDIEKRNAVPAFGGGSIAGRCNADHLP